MLNKGRIILVGAGPGDPDLLTLKGLKAIQTADVILYDALVNKKLLEYNLLADKVFVGKRKGHHSIRFIRSYSISCYGTWKLCNRRYGW